VIITADNWLEYRDLPVRFYKECGERSEGILIYYNPTYEKFISDNGQHYTGAATEHHKFVNEYSEFDIRVMLEKCDKLTCLNQYLRNELIVMIFDQGLKSQGEVADDLENEMKKALEAKGLL